MSDDQSQQLTVTYYGRVDQDDGGNWTVVDSNVLGGNLPADIYTAATVEWESSGLGPICNVSYPGPGLFDAPPSLTVTPLNTSVQTVANVIWNDALYSQSYCRVGFTGLAGESNVNKPPFYFQAIGPALPVATVNLQFGFDDSDQPVFTFSPVNLEVSDSDNVLILWKLTTAVDATGEPVIATLSGINIYASEEDNNGRTIEWPGNPPSEVQSDVWAVIDPLSSDEFNGADENVYSYTVEVTTYTDAGDVIDVYTSQDPKVKNKSQTTT